MRKRKRIMIHVKLALHLILAGLLTLSAGIFAQSMSIGHTTIVFYDGNRNRNIETEVYYPADNPGENVPVSAGSFPVLVFGHGFLMSWQSYQNFWLELVPHGYVICFPTTEMGLSPNHEDFGLDLRFIAIEMQNENANSNSIFFQTLSPNTGLMGHSMGGGASFLAAENNSSISSLINFAAAETNPSAIAAAANITVPALLFSGDDDCVTPPNQNQVLMYDNLDSDCKTHIRIINGGHCYFADDNFFCSLGESSCNPSLNITREEQQAVTFDFLNLWLQYTLYGDETAFNVFNDSLQSSTRVNFSQFCNTTSLQNPIDQSEFEIFPNPATNLLNLKLTGGNIGGLLSIFNTVGEKVYQKIVNSCNAQIDLSNLPGGAYFVIYLKDSHTYSSMVIKTLKHG